MIELVPAEYYTLVFHTTMFVICLLTGIYYLDSNSCQKLLKQYSEGFTPIRRAVFDTAKLEALGWSVSGTMEEKLRRTIDVCRANVQGNSK